ncbi:hypothetical protein D1872_231250 [compost metagenome]
MIYVSILGTRSINLSTTVDFANPLFWRGERPNTIFDTWLVFAYSAICPEISSPYTVAILAPNCSANLRFSLRPILFFFVTGSVSGVSTNKAVNWPWKTSAILAAVRITFLLDADEDRQTSI